MWRFILSKAALPSRWRWRQRWRGTVGWALGEEDGCRGRPGPTWQTCLPAWLDSPCSHRSSQRSGWTHAPCAHSMRGEGARGAPLEPVPPGTGSLCRLATRPRTPCVPAGRACNGGSPARPATHGLTAAPTPGPPLHSRPPGPADCPRQRQPRHPVHCLRLRLPSLFLEVCCLHWPGTIGMREETRTGFNCSRPVGPAPSAAPPSVAHTRQRYLHVFNVLLGAMIERGRAGEVQQ